MAEICQAIIAVAQGRSVLSPTLQSGVLDLIRDRAGASVRPSSRELELLELAAAGLTSAAIAERLHLSPNTVKTYWQRVYEKLGAGDRASAIATADGAGCTVRVALPDPSSDPERARWPAGVSDRVTHQDTLRVSPA
jgi:DNA-binding NarL/FixJ family response regulator